SYQPLSLFSLPPSISISSLPPSLLSLTLSLSRSPSSPFLHAKVREVLSDCALPISVFAFSFIGSYLFNDIELPVFKFHDGPMFNVAPFGKLSAMNVLSAMGLGFLLALLIFIDQNIVVSLTNAPENRYRYADADALYLSVYINCVCVYINCVCVCVPGC
uniref:Bicarbonate transporter-like transmembrane domain-containing protein n=1 Tax=Hucho hucho TaxID=62062 RepID=A0A4W5LA23_9TELE